MLNENPTRCSLRTQVIKHRRRTHAAAVQSADRVPSRLQSAASAFWEPLLLHIWHNENRLFLSCRIWQTVSRCDADRCVAGVRGLYDRAKRRLLKTERVWGVIRSQLGRVGDEAPAACGISGKHRKLLRSIENWWIVGVLRSLQSVSKC